MNIILSVYSIRAFKEFVLPASDNIEITLNLRRDIFIMDEDVNLKLENIDGNWYFTGSQSYGLTVLDKPYQHSPLKGGDYFKLYYKKNQILAIMIRSVLEQLDTYRKFNLKGQTLQIGMGQDCALRYSFEYDGHQFISQTHATVIMTNDGMALSDFSKNGVFVNDIRVNGKCILRFGDRIDIWGLNMVSLGTVLAIRECDNLSIDEGRMRKGDVPSMENAVEEDSLLRYHRSPRKIGGLANETVDIESPPNLQEKTEPPLYMSVGPALTMALPMVLGSGMAVVGAGVGTNSMFMYTGIVTAVLSAAIGAAWAVVNVRYNRSQSKKDENHRFEAYGDYLVRITDSIRTKYEHNSKVMCETYPAAAQCISNGLHGQRLWERNTNHQDFLVFRLGLGDWPSQTTINIPPEKFELQNDSLREKPRLIQENFSILHNVPVCIDLAAERIVGLVGGPDLMGARELTRLLTAQIAAQICYTDVKMAFIYRQDQGSDPSHWEFCRWLPHVWSQDHKTRYVAADEAQASDVFYEIMRVLRVRSEQQSSSYQQTEQPKPWYILFIEDCSILENEPIVKYIFDRQQNLGVTTLLLANQPEDLPNVCGCIVRNDTEFTGIYHLQAEEGGESQIALDKTETEPLEAFSRYLANVKVNEVEVGGEIPNTLTFFDLYGIDHLADLNVEDRWKKNRTYENMRALIGQKAGNVPCYLDIHEKYHGPHGLIAGTTGSGKSETLQTYILSLALNFSPYDVGLFLIDYKGGGMANLFNGLPHMLGQISNLSGGQIQRAMVSIKSENLRRQRIFNASGVNNINLYTTLFKSGEVTVPVPHLFIIIDEFAELKREQPDFMRELISVAQVGRSLGVHLILATQKPSGTVDDNIWSNSKFRICLRVQDRQDSMDMLHKPDAAYLTQAGRGYLQVGSDEVYEQFQSGWSGAVYDEDNAAGKQDLVRMLSNTGKTALTGSFVKRRKKEKQHLQWLTQLLSCLNNARGQGYVTEDTLCDSIYTQLAELHINFQESDYNTRILETFIRLADEVEQDDELEICASRIDRLAKARHIKLPEVKEKTQLDAVVEYLAQQAVQQGYHPLPPLWLDPLPEHFVMKQPESWPVYDKKWELSAVIGLCDDPANQAQMPLEINFSKGGHHALIGSTASGKSTFVQTLVYSLIHRYTPAYLNIYILDFSSRMTAPFEKSANMGGILYESDLERVGKLFYLMRMMLSERKKMFHGGNYEQFVMVNGVTCPAALLIIDNIAGFREKTGEEYDDILLQLAREGEAYGIYLFITGSGYGIAEIPNRIGDNLRTSMCLELTDIYQYGDALRGPQPPVFPENGIRGRGLVNLDGTVLEYQTAQCVEAEDEYSRGEAIRVECVQLNKAWQGAPARPIPFIPEAPVWQDFIQREDFFGLMSDPASLPIGYDYATAGIYSVNLRRTFCYTVSGRARTGKTNLLRIIMRASEKKEAKLIVIENNGISMKNEAAQLGAEYYSTLEETIEFVGKLGLEFQSRHKNKTELQLKGSDEDEIFEAMSKYKPWVIVISDLVDFVEMAYSPEGQRQNLGAALENLIGKGFMHNIYFVAGFNQDQRVNIMGQPVYEYFVHDRTGIHLGGNVGAQQLFEYNGMPFKDQNIAEKPGVGLTPSNENENWRRVIIPLAKG